MKKTTINTIARILLAAVLIIFGLNKFIGFMPMPEMPGAPGAFMKALNDSGYMMPFVGAAEVIIGLLLITNKYVSLALVMLVPVSLNLIAFHLALAPAGIGPALLVTVLNFYLLFSRKEGYNEVLQA